MGNLTYSVLAEVARLVPRDGIHFLAGYATYSNEPAVLEIGKPVIREHPDSAAIILIQRLRRIIRQSICFAEDGNLSILRPGHTIVSG